MDKTTDRQVLRAFFPHIARVLFSGLEIRNRFSAASGNVDVELAWKENKYIWRGPSHLSASLARSALTLQPRSSITYTDLVALGPRAAVHLLFLFIGVDLTERASAASKYYPMRPMEERVNRRHK